MKLILWIWLCGRFADDDGPLGHLASWIEIGREQLASGDFFDDVHPFRNLADNGVVAVEGRSRHEGDVEPHAPGIRITVARVADRADFVRRVRQFRAQPIADVPDALVARPGRAAENDLADLRARAIRGFRGLIDDAVERRPS